MSPAIVASPMLEAEVALGVARREHAGDAVDRRARLAVGELARRPRREPASRCAVSVRRDRDAAAGGERRRAADVIAVVMREQHGLDGARPASAVASRIAC